MRHEEARALIEEHYLGELAVDRSQALRAHLRECTPCRGCYDRWAAMEHATGDARSRVERLAPLVGGVAVRSTPLRSKRIRAAAAFAALAAAVLLILLLFPRAQTFPADVYQLELQGGEKEWRGDGRSETRILSPSTRLTLVLTPKAALDTKTEAQAYFRRGGELRRWIPEIVESADQSWRLSGLPAAALKLEPGDWEVVVLVGPAGRLPAPDDIRAGAGNILRADIRVK